MTDSASQSSLRKLKELLAMLDPSSSSGRGKRRHELLELLNEMCLKNADYFHLTRPHAQNCAISEIIPRFMFLLRECVLTHQWSRALQILEVMCRDVKVDDRVIWKVSVASLMQVDGHESRLLQQFIKQACVLRDLAVVEVLVEFLLHHLLHGDLTGARDLITDLKKGTQYCVDLKDPRRQMAKTLFDSYQGLTLYAKWKQAIWSYSRSLLDDGPLSQQSQSGSEPIAIADLAIDCLTPLKDKPGIWDVFLSRVVEMYMYYNRVSEARQVLTDYVKHNPCNPNAYRYMYELEVEAGGNSYSKIKHLKDLIKLDPCNPLCVDLYNLLGMDDPASVCLLFDYLDFDHCSSDLKVLSLLANRLERIEEDALLLHEVKRCWELRKTWWPLTVLKGVERKRPLKLPESSTQEADQDGDVIEKKQIIRDTLKNI